MLISAVLQIACARYSPALTFLVFLAMSSHSRAHSIAGDGNTISRATSVSRRSAMSKNQSLIRKSTAVHELRPSDILIEVSPSHVRLASF